MNDYDLKLLRLTFDVARQAREHGNHPFGALLADTDGNVLLTAENTVVTDIDITGHAETNLVREAFHLYESDFLASCTLFASTEPCPMCAGAIFWSNIRRVVFGLSQEGLYALTNTGEDELLLSCREVFAHGKKPIEVIGPLLEDEAKQVHIGFWLKGVSGKKMGSKKPM
jgi:tRNA(Arg) A34 adenosine deaminase TadA